MQLPTLSNSSNPWIAPPGIAIAPGKPLPKLRLFCLPSAGGGATQYRTWRKFFSDEIQIVPVQLPGRENRASEPFVRSISSMVEVMTAALEPELSEFPFAIFGHSMGALIAYEWTHHLLRMKLPTPRALYVSGRCAPHVHSEHGNLSSAPDTIFFSELQRIYAGIPPELEMSPEVLAYYLPLLRADIGLVETYTYMPRPPLGIPVQAFAGIDDPSLQLRELAAWQHTTQSQFSIKLFPGGHFYEQAPLCAAIGAHLQSILSNTKTHSH